MISFDVIRSAAYKLKHDFIVRRDGFYLRPMRFDADGCRIRIHQCETLELESYEEVETRLKALVAAEEERMES